MLNGVRFLWSVLENSRAKAHLPSEKSMEAVFEAKLYFYAVALVSRKFERKKLVIAHNARNSTINGMKV